MNGSATSLDRLHDIVVPPPVPWWPPAPGWYVLFALLVALLFFFTIRAWQKWRANAYRRAALRELETAHTAAAVSEILRRTALVTTPRTTLAGLSGPQWTEWLATHSPTPLPQQVGELLANEIYRDADEPHDVEALRHYATNWIRHHQRQVPTDT
ncbi:hypothetical protein Pan258_23960 [Symmachiella dynata]|uniref:DUF4381 domain-containing protein n=1 Tax=Symmachiella dynata TaxID=2527995 RepID=UPI00118820A4|nr:DUF4381 domain-containing protein [Symmachiella dynata]QDT48354.1 hypothetical protein Pan258_23960 [Symmachiella dynata]